MVTSVDCDAFVYKIVPTKAIKSIQGSIFLKSREVKMGYQNNLISHRKAGKEQINRKHRIIEK